MATQSTVLPPGNRIQITRRTKGDKFHLERVLLYLALIGLSVLFLFPFFWTVTSSLKQIDELYLFPPTFFPESPQWVNYQKVLQAVPFLRWALNSLIVVILSTSGTVLTATLAAYAFARFRFRGREVLFIITLGTLMLPAQVTLIPQYVLFHRMDWINTFKPLWVPAWFGGNAFAIFLIRQFIMSLPKELDEAALIDGASYPRIFFQILAPLCKPVLATITVITFNDVWNDFINPVIYLQLPEKYTLAAGLNYFRTVPEMGGEPTQHLLLAASVMVITPVILLFFATQRYFVRGIVLSGIKG